MTPGLALLTDQWYTKREQGARTGLWFSFNGCVFPALGRGVFLALWMSVFTSLFTACVSITPETSLSSDFITVPDRSSPAS